MHELIGTLEVAALVMLTCGGATIARWQRRFAAGRNAYVVTPLVSNLASRAATGDAVPQNYRGSLDFHDDAS